jgi:hypothetical protein
MIGYAVAASATGAPSTATGVLMHFRPDNLSTAQAMQIFAEYGTGADQAWMRFATSTSAWSSWIEITSQGASAPKTTAITTASYSTITSDVTWVTNIDVSDGPGVLEQLLFYEAGGYAATDEYDVKVTIDGTLVINETNWEASDYDSGDYAQFIGPSSTYLPVPLFYRSTLKVEAKKYDSGAASTQYNTTRHTYSIS